MPIHHLAKYPEPDVYLFYIFSDSFITHAFVLISLFEPVVNVRESSSRISHQSAEDENNFRNLKSSPSTHP